MMILGFGGVGLSPEGKASVDGRLIQDHLV
jgi:hypothetical protein